MISERVRAATPREMVLRGHLLKYRASTAAQIGAAYYHDTKQPQRNARRLLDRLANEGLLQKQPLVARVLPDLLEPTWSWRPGGSLPCANRLCYQLEKRFSGESIPTTVYYATRSAATRFGGRGGRLKRTHQISHDLLCTSVYLHLEANAFQLAADWLNEDLYAGHAGAGQKLGDALLMRKGQPYRMIEVLGRYTARHLTQLFDYCVRKQLSFDLW